MTTHNDRVWADIAKACDQYLDGLLTKQEMRERINSLRGAQQTD